MATLTVYASKSCVHCAKIIPLVRQAAKRKKVQVNVVNVDNCHTSKCDAVRYTPFFEVSGKEVSLKKVVEMLK